MKTKITLFLMLLTFISYGQKSPPEKAEGKTKSEVTITIEYSSPRVKGRTVFGDLVPYSNVWRAGANKNTTIKFDKNVTVNGQELAAGKYGFFIIPNEDGMWTVIFNKNNDGWGSYGYKESDDALRINVTTTTSEDSKEELTYAVVKDEILFSWDTTSFVLNVK
jgi:hypothetical protein|tara:strand:+ start:180 stop:671 length:492 start_codon:yes stop_codon:yes gene_type:complete